MTVSTATHANVDNAELIRRAREIVFNVLLSLFFFQFAVRHFGYAMEVLRLSTVLILFKVSTDVVFYLIRRVPKDVSMSLYDWVIAIAGTYFIMFLQPVPGSDVLFGQVLQMVGLALQTMAMLSLNRSIGMVAANRGIQTNGLYRYVRHPLYLSYLVAFSGYVINQFSVYNVFIFATATALWILRLLAEEKFLMQSREYREYAEQVPYRIVPKVF